MPILQGPRVFTWSAVRLARSRELARAGDASLQPALAKLRVDADALVAGPVVAVTDKPADAVMPSGDPHDYGSVSVYFWPDPSDPKAPWVGKDGSRNHDAVNKYDSPRLAKMCDRVVTCSLAYYFLGDDRYAESAAAQLRAWFVDERTRMNPHMEYAQFVPNKSKGEPWGIIDANRLPEVLNAVGLLADSGHWSASDDAALKEWFREYANWLDTSDLGRREAKADNNHGTFYDLQLASAALYAGDVSLAMRVLSEVPAKRLAVQIRPDGATPHEQRRPNAAMYTCWNLKGLAELAVLAKQVDIDLWAWHDADGRSLKRTAEWLAPYLAGEKAWTFGVDPIRPTSATDFFWIAHATSGDPFVADMLTRVINAPERKDKWSAHCNMLVWGEPHR